HYKPDSLEECDTDDTGRVVFDERGQIMYPTSPKESFMRHRHYNWDVVFATPDITSIPRPCIFRPIMNTDSGST
ncbi:zonular occludens toxin domain-containing protein, partial [Aeromonas salmonicida]